MASQTRILPLFQDRTVAPSGLLPSDLQIPNGSRSAEILADASDLLTRSFIAEWCRCRPALFRQCRPWVPRQSSGVLHSWNLCGRQSGMPRRRPVATRKTSSSMRKPRHDTGRVCSQAPASFLLAARRRAWAGASGAASCRAWKEAATRGASHAFCLGASAARGAEASSPSLHTWRVSSCAW